MRCDNLKHGIRVHVTNIAVLFCPELTLFSPIPIALPFKTQRAEKKNAKTPYSSKRGLKFTKYK